MAKLISYSEALKFSNAENKITDVLQGVKKQIPAFIDVILNPETLTSCFNRAQYLKNNFEELVVIGIGGSHLGAESFVKALSFPRNVIFMENPDPVGISRRLSALKDITKTHFVFVSKSGSTFETLAIGNWILDQLKILNLPVKKHCTVITEDEKNLLGKWAKAHEVFYVNAPAHLSGRYSVLSPAGLLPIYFALDVALEEPLQGAIKAFNDESELIQYTSLLWGSIQNRYRILNFWNYSDQMQSFGKWWRQLWSESLGHQLKGDLTSVPVCVLCRGASDQHSYLQQVIDQNQKQLNVVLTVKQTPEVKMDLEINKDQFGSDWSLSGTTLTRLFQRESNGLIKTFEDLDIPHIHLELKEIGLDHLTYFVIQQQLAIAILGHALDVNPYIQPAVEQMKLRIKDQVK